MIAHHPKEKVCCACHLCYEWWRYEVLFCTSEALLCAPITSGTVGRWILFLPCYLWWLMLLLHQENQRNPAPSHRLSQGCAVEYKPLTTPQQARDLGRQAFCGTPVAVILQYVCSGEESYRLGGIHLQVLHPAALLIYPTGNTEVFRDLIYGLNSLWGGCQKVQENLFTSCLKIL